MTRVTKELQNDIAVFSGEKQPIELQMGEKVLQILNIHRDTKMESNVDFVIIDPKDATQYKGIRNEESVVLGRAQKSRFSFGKRVSRLHASISRVGNNFVIQDLHSANGTVVTGEEVIDAESEILRNNAPNFFNDIALLVKFLEKSPFSDRVGPYDISPVALERYIYKNFYGGVEDGLLLSDAEVIKQKEKLDQVLEPQSEIIKRMTKQGDVKWPNGVSYIYETDSWLWSGTYVGGENTDNMGRLYLNLSLDNRYDDFNKLALLIKEKFGHGNPKQITLKTARPTKSMRRSDNTVVYFNSEDSKEVFDTITSFYLSNLEAFSNKAPRFTARVKNKNKKMKGIGFAQNIPPSSFGSRMSFFFAEAFIRGAKNETDFIEEHLKLAGSTWYNPAFGTIDGLNKFKSILHRLQQ